MNCDGGKRCFPLASRKSTDKTRKPIDKPLVLSNRKRIVFAPETNVFAGRSNAIDRTAKPPPIPPNALPGPSILTVLLLN